MQKLACSQISMIEPIILQCLSTDRPKSATEIGQHLDRIAPDSGVTSTQFVAHLFKMPQIQIHKNVDCIRFSKQTS